VTEEVPGHFRIAVGGKAKLAWNSAGLGATGPAVPGFEPSIKTADVLRVSAGGKLKVTKMGADSSISVLIPGHGPLRYRACLDRQKHNLIGWFAVNESNAWEAVNALYQETRPDRIFLVVGQTMTTEYSITHQDEDTHGCDIHVSANVELPTIIGAKAHLGYAYQSVAASAGFEVMMKSDGHSSVYLEVYSSPPQLRINILQRPLKVRLEGMFKLI